MHFCYFPFFLNSMLLSCCPIFLLFSWLLSLSTFFSFLLFPFTPSSLFTLFQQTQWPVPLHDISAICGLHLTHRLWQLSRLCKTAQAAGWRTSSTRTPHGKATKTVSQRLYWTFFCVRSVKVIPKILCFCVWGQVRCQYCPLLGVCESWRFEL